MSYDRTAADQRIFTAYTTKEVDLRFRGASLRFGLSHGLFSSADIDSGSRLLLKTVSALLDADSASGASLPRAVLDAGSGVGVLGIAVAKALADAGVPDVRVRAQDRDELARVFGASNAAANGLGPDVFEAFAEKLLSGPSGTRYDLILSNLPAKAGGPVLADFYLRSCRMLGPRGRVATVIVNTLAEAARRWIADAGAPLLAEEKGSEHTVFITGAAPGTEGAGSGSDPYERTAAEHELEGVRYSIRAVHGVADFSEPSRAARLAAKLAAKPPLPARLLVHEPEQGHFPAFIAAAARKAGKEPPETLVCGRNALALEASVENAAAAGARTESAPAADLGLCAPALEAGFGRFDLVASFPDVVPRTDRFADWWEGAAHLTADGGRFLVALSSTDAARFDKLKTAAFARAGDLKRDGFRAMAYRRL